MTPDLSTALAFLDRCRSGAPADLLAAPALTLAEAGKLRIAYAPFDHVESAAPLAIVGITPGRQQAVNALRAAQAAMHRGAAPADALREAKLTGSFSGPIRANLVAMLDGIGLARHLGTASTGALFAPGSTAIHFTSALRYPVFLDGANYAGTPDMLRTPILRHLVETCLAEEVQLLPRALWLPLGPKPEAALQHLARMGLLDPGRILAGMPHPSGANGERVAVFLGRKPAAAASRQTRADALTAAFDRLSRQVDGLGGEPA